MSSLGLKKVFTLAMAGICLGVYLAWVQQTGFITVSGISVPVPTFVSTKEKTPEAQIYGVEHDYLHPVWQQVIEQEKQDLIAARRQAQIDKVESFFASYGSPLVGYGDIFVDKSEECGGDYRVLVGIAGSESGLGRINYKLYNPFGYLDGVQYPDQKTALEILACKVSTNHISVCGTDLWCLVRRYAGPMDDQAHFVSKVQWFYNQVD